MLLVLKIMQNWYGIIFPFLEHCCSNVPVIDLYYMTMLAIIYDVVASGYCCLLQLQVMMPSGNWKLTHFRKIGLITGFNTSWSSFIKKNFTQYFVMFIDFSKFRSAISLWRIMEKWPKIEEKIIYKTFNLARLKLPRTPNPGFRVPDCSCNNNS